jgi:hypothetical protein
MIDANNAKYTASKPINQSILKIGNWRIINAKPRIKIRPAIYFKKSDARVFVSNLFKYSFFMI